MKPIFFIVSVLLFLIFIYPFFNSHVDTKTDRARNDIRMISEVLELYKDNHGQYPSTDEGLETLVSKRYLSDIPVDPWGSPYIYISSGPDHISEYELWSTGDDGRKRIKEKED